MTVDIRSQLQATLSGAYTLERELGGGGMSRVFVADETRLGRKVVVKVLSPELAAGISAERFEREIKVAASLQQANIVPVLSAGDANGLPFYTMPFVAGESLRARVQRGALPIAEVVSVLREVVRALAYAHENGVVHRDIKPDNVLLSGGAAVVTDFGIAKAISASRTDSGGGATLTQLGTSIGTPAYISPEQAAGDPDVDQRADIYSFGCMAYELLAGRPPFVARTAQRLIGAHMSERPQPISELRPEAPAALAAMVMRCLEKDPSARPESAAELFPALDATPSSDSALAAMPPILLGGRDMLRKALAVYAAAFVVVAIVAKSAIIGIGLPDWVFPGALVVMALGLPVILFTAYTQLVTRRMLTSSPTFTPGGSATRPTHGTMATIAMKASPHVSWRRTTLGGVYVIGAFVLVVGAFMLMRVLGIGPAGSLIGRGSVTPREPLLITDFATRGADANLGSVVTEAVRADLGQSAAISLVPAVTVAAALQRMQRPPSTRVDMGVAREIAAREGIKGIVDGEVTSLGAGYVLAVRLVSADSGLELTSFRTVVTTPADLIDGINKISRQLRGKIGESLRSVHASPPLAQVTTGSLDALRKYTEGIRANRAADYPRAVALLREAVALDSNFATAWALLAGAMANGRPFPQSQQDSAIAMAYRFRDRMTPAGRMAAEARYFSTGPGRDLSRGLAIYEKMFAQDSSPATANAMGNVLSGLGQFARAESLFTFALQRAPETAFPYGNIVAPQFNQGKVSEAEASIALARKRHPEYLTAVILDATLHYHKRDLARYRRALDSLRNSSTPRLRVTGSHDMADLERLQGRFQAAERLLSDARRLDGAVGQANPPIVDSIALAFEDAWFRGQSERATRRLDDAVARYPLKNIPLVDRPYFALASAYAVAGQPARAREILRDFEAAADTSLRRAWDPRVQATLGEIALAEAKPRDAVEHFNRAHGGSGRNNLRDPSTAFALLGRAYDLAREPDSAIVMFQRYLNTPSWDRFRGWDDPTYLAATYKRLGELYEAKGDRQNAASYYSKFVDLWKNADPDLQPKVTEVKKRLARLSDTETKR